MSNLTTLILQREKEWLEMTQDCKVPDPVDSIPEDAWVNGWFEAMKKAESFNRQSTLFILKAIKEELVEELETKKTNLLVEKTWFNGWHRNSVRHGLEIAISLLQKTITSYENSN